MLEDSDGKYDIGLMLNEKSDKDYNDVPRNDITLYVVKVYERDKIRNPSSSTESEVGYCGLEISGSQSTDFEAQTYAWGCAYTGMYNVDLPRAKAMVAMLEKIQRGLDKRQQKHGYSPDFATYVGRIAEILGCSKMVWRTSHNANWDYDSDIYHVVDIGRGVDQVRHVTQEWRRQHPYFNRYAQAS